MSRDEGDGGDEMSDEVDGDVKGVGLLVFKVIWDKRSSVGVELLNFIYSFS